MSYVTYDHWHAKTVARFGYQKSSARAELTAANACNVFEKLWRQELEWLDFMEAN